MATHAASLVVVFVCALWLVPWQLIQHMLLDRVVGAKRAMFDLLTVLLWDMYYKWYWGQHHPADICAQQTGVPASFWNAHMDQCDASLRAHFEAFIALVGTIVFIVWLVWCLRACVWYVFIFVPSMWVRQTREATVAHRHGASAGRLTPQTRLLERLMERWTPRRATQGGVVTHGATQQGHGGGAT